VGYLENGIMRTMYKSLNTSRHTRAANNRQSICLNAMYIYELTC